MAHSKQNSGRMATRLERLPLKRHADPLALAGYISVDDFKHAMRNLGDGLPQREVDEMLQVGGVTNGWLDYRSWVKNMLAS